MCMSIGRGGGGMLVRVRILRRHWVVLWEWRGKTEGGGRTVEEGCSFMRELSGGFLEWNDFVVEATVGESPGFPGPAGVEELRDEESRE